MSQRASAEVGDLAAPSSLWDRFVGSWAWPTTVFVLLLVGWEAYVRLSGILPVILPAPSAVLSYMWVQRELLLENAWPTVLHCLLGFVLAVVGGIAIAVLITQFTTIRRGFYPLVVGIALIPKISVAPLFTLWFGAGTVARVSLVFFIAFFPMVVSPASGLRVPSAMPYVFDGMKVAMSLAVIGIIVAEFVTADRGLGYLVIFATGLLDTTMMLAAIILLSIIGLGLYFAIETAGRIVVYWRS